MGKYFTLEELSRSATAEAHGIENRPPAVQRENMESLINNLLDPLRELWDRPLRVNSGYRSPELNRMVGGTVSSQHMAGEAADITAGSREANRELFDIILKSSLEFDQLIGEKGFSWLHISYRKSNNRHQVFSL